MHSVRVGVIDLIVIPGVSSMGNYVSATRGKCFQGMTAKNPIADIDDVNILLYDDVAG